jgi:hypothetical protein
MPLLGILAMGSTRREEERPRPSYADPNSADFDPARAMDWMHGGGVPDVELPPEEPRLDIETVLTGLAVQHSGAFIPMERALDPERFRDLGVDDGRPPVLMADVDSDSFSVLIERLRHSLLLKGDIVVDLRHRGLEGGFRPGELVDLRNPFLPAMPPRSNVIPTLELTREEILDRIGALNPDALPKVFHALEGIDRFRAAQAAQTARIREALTEPEDLQPSPAPTTEPEGDWRTIELPLDRLCAALGYPVHRALYIEHLKPVSEALVKQARKGAKRTGQTFDATYNTLIEQRIHARRYNVPRRLTCQVCGGAHHTWS